MPQKSIRQALNEALAQEMRRDPRVIVIGEDVAGGAGSQGQRDAYGGVLGVTKGLFGEFGEGRVVDRVTDDPGDGPDGHGARGHRARDAVIVDDLGTRDPEEDERPARIGPAERG